MKLFVSALLALSASGALAYDAIIIGGGLSGLSAARELAKAGKNYTVLEARDRVGGRVHNKKVGKNGYTEVGAEFIGPTQNDVQALAKELNLKLFNTYNKGSDIFWDGKKAQKFASNGIFGAIPPEDPVSLAQLASLQSKLDNMASKIKVGSPWKHPKAKEWDSMSAHDWLEKEKASKTVYTIIEVALEEIFSAKASEMSLLYVVSYVAAGGDQKNKGTFERLTLTAKGAQQWRVSGGTYLLATHLAQKLGNNIKLNSPVKSITKTHSGYAVQTKSNTTYSGKHVIVAMSPPMADTITFRPALPRNRKKLQQMMKMGKLGKGIAIYGKPFWRNKGLTGQAISMNGTTRATFDSTPEDKSFGAMMCFIQADAMTRYDHAPLDELKGALTSDLVHYYGAQAKTPKSWVFNRWDDEEYSQGAPTAWAPPNTLSQYGTALRQPVGNIHFAGTESSDYWQGYMDGAIRAGKRAAAEVH